ncbi:MAG: DUF2087 domain-containing protein [Acidimicrobiales bacterium]
MTTTTTTTTTGAEAFTLLGLLADDDRLNVVAALALGARRPADIASAAGLDVPHAGRALARLLSGGLLEQRDDGYVLVRERFRDAFDSLDRPAPPVTPESGLGADADRVLRTFMRDGQLIQIPTARAKRLVVLDFVAKTFEPGRSYPEAEVNERLRAFNADVATLRRYLVDEEFLRRRDGFYWRTGGTFEV